MPELRNLWTWLVLIVLAVGLYAVNTEIKEHRVAVAMRQREAIAAKWLKEEDYLREIEKISVEYCPTEFRAAWDEYLEILRNDSSPDGQRRKTLALAHGPTTDPMVESRKKLNWVANGYGFIAQTNLLN